MALRSSIKHITKCFGELLYPKICLCCGQHLFESEIEICHLCIHRLPKTYFEKKPDDNAISALMWGRCKVKHAYSLYFYRKGERVQQLLHSIKYRGNKNLGNELGKQLALNIKNNAPVIYDLIIPIPLHRTKQAKRGFNQSEVIAVGMSEVLNIPISTSEIYRNTYTSTQTRKSRFERWQNVESIFSLRNAEKLTNLNLLIVDDVITTGSTMEACVNTLEQSTCKSVSIATIACAAL